jgi:hypothetical protein
MATKVTADQFEITDVGIKHKPTGAELTPHPGSPTSGNLRLGRLGDKLPSGEDYRPEEVKDMMNRLWAQHINKQTSAG